jgi:hydroxymethylpyrimidine pyrophosphatase-like HAD family hydrolase
LLEGFSCSTFIYGTNDWYSQTADQWYWKECKIVHYDGIVIDFNTLLKEHETAGIPLYKLVIMQEDPNILQQIEDALRGLGLGLMIFKSSPFFIEVNPMNIDKGTTINDVASHWDIDIADTLAIGNYYNDIGMLKAAGTSIAMANSPQAVKSCASRTSIQDMDHEGFALEMERILD